MNEAVLQEIEDEFARCVSVARARNRAVHGIFPALHRHIIYRIRQSLPEFSEPEQIELLVQRFSGAFFQAFWRNEYGDESLICPWSHAYSKSRCGDFVVFQHILLAMNVHIGWDLPRALSQVVADFDSLESDYQRIGRILDAEINNCQEVLNDVSPVMKGLDILGGPFDEIFFGLGLRMVRKNSWNTAIQLSREKDKRRRVELEYQLAEDVVRRIDIVLHPPSASIRALLGLIQRFEAPASSVLHRIEKLGERK